MDFDQCDFINYKGRIVLSISHGVFLSLEECLCPLDKLISCFKVLFCSMLVFYRYSQRNNRSRSGFVISSAALSNSRCETPLLFASRTSNLHQGYSIKNPPSTPDVILTKTCNQPSMCCFGTLDSLFRYTIITFYRDRF